jgi:hypothetical protein
VQVFKPDTADLMRLCHGVGGRPFALSERRDGISRREPVVRPEKRRCALTLSRGRGGQGCSNIAAINDRRRGSSGAGCDLRSDRREAPRTAPFFVHLTV